VGEDDSLIPFCPLVKIRDDLFFLSSIQ